MNSLEVLLLEPDTEAARAVLDSVSRAFTGVRALHVESIEGLKNTSLRGVTIAICADQPPECDAMIAIDVMLQRRESLPILTLMDHPSPKRMSALLSHGASDCAPRRSWTHESLTFAIEKCLSVARLQRESLRTHAGLTRSLAELVRRNRDLAEATARLEVMASTDPLTRLNNRWWLKDRLDIMFAEAVRYGSDLACMMIDLDGFKNVNDNYGHQQGDRVLALTGELIREEIRATDVAARYGGDEFIILMPRTSTKTALNLASRLQAAFQRKLKNAMPQLTECTMCIGAACVSISRPGAAEVLIRHADTALYAAKQRGSSSIMICGADGVTPVEASKFAA